MSIPQSKLETWSHQGSLAGSRDTYATVKRALESQSAKFPNRNFDVFLQGSYGNDTNIFDESDVDVVIRYNGAFFHDLKELPADQKTAFQLHFSDGTYPYSTFKNHVQETLVSAFGDSVKPGKKAIRIEGGNARRNADVVVAFEFRRYYKFNGAFDQSFDTGIALFTSDNTRIANYPKQHSANCTAKHQATGGNFKPMVRIFKNMRSKLIADGSIGKGTAPSYFIEGLLYNVPNNLFDGSLDGIVLNILDWLFKTNDRTEFVCANEQYYLLRDNDPVCWPTANGAQFVSAAIQLWNNWP